MNLKRNGSVPLSDQLAAAESRYEELRATYERDANAAIAARAARRLSSEAAYAQTKVVFHLRELLDRERMENDTPLGLRAELADARAAYQLLDTEIGELIPVFRARSAGHAGLRSGRRGQSADQLAAELAASEEAVSTVRRRLDALSLQRDQVQREVTRLEDEQYAVTRPARPKSPPPPTTRALVETVLAGAVH